MSISLRVLIERLATTLMWASHQSCKFNWIYFDRNPSIVGLYLRVWVSASMWSILWYQKRVRFSESVFFFFNVQDYFSNVLLFFMHRFRCVLFSSIFFWIDIVLRSCTFSAIVVYSFLYLWKTRSNTSFLSFFLSTAPEAFFSIFINYVFITCTVYRRFVYGNFINVLLPNDSYDIVSKKILVRCINSVFNSSSTALFFKRPSGESRHGTAVDFWLVSSLRCLISSSSSRARTTFTFWLWPRRPRRRFEAVFT